MMSRKTKLHEALARLASKFEYGALMAETQPAAFIDSVVERLGAMEVKLREAEKRAEKAERDLEDRTEELAATSAVVLAVRKDREKAEREREEARALLRRAVPEDDGWWCPSCREALPGGLVTYDERCVRCGTGLGEISTPQWVADVRAALGEKP